MIKVQICQAVKSTTTVALGFFIGDLRLAPSPYYLLYYFEPGCAAYAAQPQLTLIASHTCKLSHSENSCQVVLTQHQFRGADSPRNIFSTGWTKVAQPDRYGSQVQKYCPTPPLPDDFHSLACLQACGRIRMWGLIIFVYHTILLNKTCQFAITAVDMSLLLILQGKIAHQIFNGEVALSRYILSVCDHTFGPDLRTAENDLGLFGGNSQYSYVALLKTLLVLGASPKMYSCSTISLVGFYGGKSP